KTINNVDFVNGKKTFRNFFLSKYSQTKSGKGTADANDYYGFFRAVSGTYTTYNRAYLHFPVALYTNPQGGNADLSEADLSAKGFQLSILPDEDENVTSIDSVSSETKKNDNKYYTLQGVRMDFPTSKGVYIYNGKKIVVK
ncbi:MAG: hypothetical protein IJV27_05365, partial [Prevotella sp.]|nr:hypothetical protein [Prevotella sp.]